MTLTLDEPQIVDSATAEVTLYSQPGCGPCVGVERALKSAKIPFVIRDITADPMAHARVVELGYTGTPVVEHPGGHFKGLDVDQIAKIQVPLF